MEDIGLTKCIKYMIQHNHSADALVKEKITIMDRGVLSDIAILREYADHPDTAIAYPDDDNVRCVHREVIGSVLCKVYYQVLPKFVEMLDLNKYTWKICLDLKDCTDANEMETVMMRLCETESCESKLDTFENQYCKISNHIKTDLISGSKDNSVGYRFIEYGSGPLICYDKNGINKMTWILPWSTWQWDGYTQPYVITLNRIDK